MLKPKSDNWVLIFLCFSLAVLIFLNWCLILLFDTTLFKFYKICIVFFLNCISSTDLQVYELLLQWFLPYALWSIELSSSIYQISKPTVLHLYNCICRNNFELFTCFNHFHFVFICLPQRNSIMTEISFLPILFWPWPWMVYNCQSC